jgi:hypothetical protein
MICRCCFGRWPTTLGQWKILEEKKRKYNRSEWSLGTPSLPSFSANVAGAWVK